MTPQEIYKRQKHAEEKLYSKHVLDITDWATYAETLDRIITDILNDMGFEVGEE